MNQNLTRVAIKTALLSAQSELKDALNYSVNTPYHETMKASKIEAQIVYINSLISKLNNTIK